MRALIFLTVGFWLLWFLSIWGMIGHFGKLVPLGTAAIWATVITVVYGLGAYMWVGKKERENKRNGYKAPGFSREEIDEMFLVDRSKSRFDKPSDE